MNPRELAPPRITPARDPALDGSPARRAWAAIKAWSPGVAMVLAFAAVQGQIDKWDNEAFVAQQAGELANARADLAILRNAHEHRTSTGCATLLWLVEGDAGEKLLQASMAIDRARLEELDTRPPEGRR
jgi:hypothetical protein